MCGFQVLRFCSVYGTGTKGRVGSVIKPIRKLDVRQRSQIRRLQNGGNKRSHTYQTMFYSRQTLRS